ncbi:MAG: hypothetical protein K6E59_02360 [Bacilli bacterium]|nr:hypothetical protein [Bacilli bacterium]
MPQERLPETIYYSDPLHDEFSTMEIHSDPILEDYKYIRDGGFFGKVKRFFLFHLIAKPIAWFYLKKEFHHEIVGKWQLKRYRKQAIFLYGNHTQIIGDALMPAFMVSPRYINVIVHPNNVNIPTIGKFVPLLGGLPLPGNAKAKQNFAQAIGKRVTQHQPIFIYPEAHIWPYYTGVRPFVSDSFSYPVYYGAPVFCFTNTYHKRKNGKVRIRTYIDGPFFADPELTPKEAREQLRNEVYNTMCERAALSTYQKIAYVKKEEQ